MRRPVDPELRPGPPPRVLALLLLAVAALHGLLLLRWVSPRADRFGAPAPMAPAMQVRTVVLLPPPPPVELAQEPATATPAAPPADVRDAPPEAPPPARAAAEAVALDAPAPPAPPAQSSPLAPLAPPAPAESSPPPAVEPRPPAFPFRPDLQLDGAEPEGDETPIAAGDTAPPVYATRLPGDATLRYRLQRGSLTGDAWLVWRTSGERYTLDFVARGGLGRPMIEQHSHGALDAGGLAPERFADRRRGRAPQSAQFDRAGGAVRFSGPSHTYPAWPGAQDRLGWIVQLAAIQAAAVHEPPGEPLAEATLFVVGARGGAGWWTFRRLGREPVALPSGAVADAWHFERRPAVPRDLHVEAWLDPARGFWPVRLRWRPALGGPPLELLLSADPDTQPGR